jgi:VanZ family protein
MPAHQLLTSPSRISSPPSEATVMTARNIPFSLVIWFLAICVWFAWSPFALRTGTPPNYNLAPSLDLHILGHFVFLMPLAVVLAVAAETDKSRRPFLYPWLIVTGAAVVLEVGQWWIQGRSIGPHDVLLGSLGSAAAIAGTRMVLRIGLRRQRLLMGTWAITFVAVAITNAVGLVFPERDFRLASWDPDFQVVAGQETDGSRPYRGEIRDARVCSGTPPDQLCIGPGARDAERRELIRMASQTQQVSVSAWVWPESPNQTGPARIVSFSRGTGQRNITLGQEDSDLVFRVRTPWTGRNGIYPQFVLRKAVPDSGPWRVEGVFSAGTVMLMAEQNGTRIRGIHSFEGPGPALETQLEEGRPIPAYFGGRGGVFGAGVLFTGVGLGAAWALRSRRHVRWVAGPVAAVLGLWVYDALLPGSRIPTGHELLFAAAAALVGSALGILDHRNWQRRRTPEPPPASHLRPGLRS